MYVVPKLNVPASFGGINTSFGMDMSMPFLEQQNWEE